MQTRNLIALLFLLTADTSCAWAAPCDGVARDLTDKRNVELAPKIAEYLHVASVDVLEELRIGSWSIVSVETHQSDEPYLFFAHDPLTHGPITLWSGAASYFEEDSIRHWVVKHAPNIPPKLARCFAWHVTRDRNW